jgi:UDP:flavonoid glycosyltransferase YjiC (YdhE family)
MASLERKIPMVLVPMILDQLQISWLVSAAGAGIRIPRWKCSPERLGAAVARVLAEQQFRDNTARIRADFREYSGGDLAAHWLEKLAGAESG